MFRNDVSNWLLDKITFYEILKFNGITDEIIDDIKNCMHRFRYSILIASHETKENGKFDKENDLHL